MPAPNIVLVQTALADYRESVLEELSTACDGGFVALSGKRYFDPSVETRMLLRGRHRVVENRFLLGRRLLWQHSVLGIAVRGKVAMLELNPRILSTWVILIGRRLSGKRSILWGHAWSRSGPRPLSTLVRRLLWRLAGVVVMYTHTQAEEVASTGTRTLVFAAPNALYPRSAIGAGDSRPGGFLIVGRLVDEKKPLLAIGGFLAALDQLADEDRRLVFVGDGPLRSPLERAVVAAGAERHVTLLGHVGDLPSLRNLYDGVLASISPGYVGLSIIQSISFGVPMVVAEHEPHAPEIEAAQVGFNCIYFRSDDVNALAKALAVISDRRGDWIARRPDIARVCANEYSMESTANGLLSAIAATQRPRRTKMGNVEVPKGVGG
jgi:glycosyltransferase involved in cell wall biosynthesis